ncbi:unnamed protein product [Linum tenue]|uniref:glutathione transferase n=1 Tax=Linum tenue TaxID=586396 RepID=A0AAV0RHY4_9ROSI|nr:unnamed protein product [Linum tenue]
MAAREPGEEEEVKLIKTWSSPYALRAVWALKLKGIPYESIDEDLTHKSDILLHHNPVHKKVPVLLHHGRSICESLVIIEYIEETWSHNPPRLLPEDPLQRAETRFWAKFVDDKALPSIWQAFSKEGKEQEQGLSETAEHFRLLEAELKKKKKRLFFGGEEIGIVDIALGWVVNLVPLFERILGVKFLDEERHPALLEWRQRMSDVDVVKESWPPRDKLVAKWTAIRERCGLRVIWALKLKGIPYDSIDEDLANKSDLLLQYNPVHKKVPVLIHNGKPVCESLVILEYIDEAWSQNPPRLLPRDPVQRASARFWAKFADEKVRYLVLLT